jgi:hypothetical protein
MRAMLCVLLPLAAATVAFAADPATVLARLLTEKGAITAEELSSVESASQENRVALLAAILERKGVLTSVEVARFAPDMNDRPVSAQVRFVPAVQQTLAPVQTPNSPQASGGTVAAPAPPVTAQSKFPVTIYGTLLTNAFFDTSAMNIQDVPLIASKQGSDPTGGDKSFGMTARQTRVGLRYQGPQVNGAKVSGQFEFDLFGGKAALGNGINMDLFRLRLAFGRLDWENFSIEAGQDWSVFAPLNPTTLAEYAIPGMSGAGNPWIRTPQFRVELHSSINDTSRVQLQVGATDPDMGDYQTAQFLTTRTPGIGERGRLPGFDARLGLTTKAAGRDFALGLSSHYARGKNFGTIGTRNIQTGVDSWGVALDYSLPITKVFSLTGEAFEGRALGIFSASSGQAILPVGTPGEHGVETRGGWAQAQFTFTPKWQLNLAYGIDAPNVSQLRVGDRSRNQNYMGNVMYKFSPAVTFAWEWRRILSDYRNQIAANERGDHINMAISYAF